MDFDSDLANHSEFLDRAKSLGTVNLAQKNGDTSMHTVFMEHNIHQVSVTSQSIPSSTHTYHLVSVVEHFGRAGSGHYTVYRRMTQVLDNEDPQPAIDHWFSISDSEVYGVSKKDVLAAEASLLFYERVSEG